VRSTVQCLGAVLGGAQSIHVMGYDEAFEIPSEEAVTVSLRTQQIIALETGVTRTADPLAGSYFVEHLTDEIEARAREVLQQVEDAGGAVAALEQGLPQRWIAESAYKIEREIADGSRPKVGVNVHSSGESGSRDLRLFQADRDAAPRQIERLRASVHRRDAAAHADAMRRLEDETSEGRNVMPAVIAAARAGATVGEMSTVFRRLFGEFREPQAW
jgi:methylmalonyl-CoA mutase, N-terminal domain